jgi:RimJ/RimL family protein N-acetyltransferase
VIQFPLETDRLRIRPFTLGDAEALHEVWGDPASERFSVAGGLTPASVEETRKYLEEIVSAQRHHGFASCAVIEKESGALIGDCGLFVSPDQPDVELAYGFAHAWWGRGYATEAAAACVRAGFEQLGLDRIVADVPIGHAASIRVLEKLGFELEREEGGKRYYAIKRENPR